jgi:hypothetical protein
VGLTYDTGALIAADRGDRRMWLLHRRALDRGETPTVPAPVVVEAWRGQPLLARLLVGTVVEPLDDAGARVAGALLGRSDGGLGAVDATVVAGALRRRDVVVTSDRDDLERLAHGVGRRLAVIDI